MAKIPAIISGNKMTLLIRGKLYPIKSTHYRYVDIQEALKEDASEDAVLELLQEPTLEEYTKNKEGVEVRDGQVYVNGEVLRNSLATRLVQLKSSGFPIDSLIKFVERLEKNPSYRSRDQLYDFLEHEDLVITDDGCFLAYKGLRDDYLDRYSGTIDNSPGRTIKMDRRKIDDDPNKGCSKGLHVGAFQYADNWRSGGKLVIVKVDPANVVSVPQDCSHQKCRVCEYTVLRDADGIMREPLYDTQGRPYTPEEYDGDYDHFDDDYDDMYDEGEVYSYDDMDDDDDDYEESEIEQSVPNKTLLDVFSNLLRSRNDDDDPKPISI